MSTFVVIIIILIIVIIDIATVIGGKMNYPLLKNRSSDIKSWQFDDIEVTITAAYLEIIAGAFFLEDVFLLQPTDSLENLYHSYYKKNIFGVDDMELELCAIDYEKLCQTADIEFAYQSTIYDQLKTIAEYRNNQPVTADEAACLGIKMIFLPLLKADAADKNAFFTGKPMIDELGYSFLFRDYNPNQGKWTTTDPLGYPDGWNNLAYCNNGVTVSIDWFGGVTISSFQNAIDFYAINTDSNFTATIADSIILETLSSENYNNYYNQLVSNLGNVSTISNSGSLDAGGVVSWFQGLILGRTTTIITGEIKWVASDWIKDSNGGYSRNIVATGTIKLTINDRWDFEEHKNDSWIKNLLEEIGPGYIADTWALLVNGDRTGIPYNLSGFANHNISIVTTQKE